jgi:formate dehydrogenase subunit gamma
MINSVRAPLPAAVEPRHAPIADNSWVARFGRTERFAHWWTVLMVVIALVTGLAMGDESGGGVMLWLHAGSVALIGVGLTVAAVFGDRRALLGSARQLFSFDGRDHDWIRARTRHPLQRHAHQRSGLFNTGQKLLTWSLTASIIAVVATGVMSWRSGGEGGGLHGPAVVVTMLLLSAHVFMAVVNPATRPALAGMVFGRVRRSWAATHHRAWLDEVDGPRGES